MQMKEIKLFEKKQNKTRIKKYKVKNESYN